MTNLVQKISIQKKDEMTQMDRIELCLFENGITKPEFQKQLGILSQHWNNWKIRGIPSIRLFQIAENLGVTISYLYSGEEPKYNADKISDRTAYSGIQGDSNGEMIDALNDLSGYLNTLVARHYRGRALGGLELKEHENMMAALSRGRSLCARLIRSK